jgi:CheY-like chemotaxis protein
MAKTKILVVDDERIIAKDIQDMLEDFCYDFPAIASSGEEAIKKAEEIKPDLVLMNIGLKGDMDGIDAAAHIHNRFNIPVVYVTAYMDEKRLERANVTEPFGYIIKPFEDKELASAIEKALGGNPKERL